MHLYVCLYEQRGRCGYTVEQLLLVGFELLACGVGGTPLRSAFLCGVVWRGVVGSNQVTGCLFSAWHPVRPFYNMSPFLVLSLQLVVLWNMIFFLKFAFVIKNRVI